MYFFVFASHLHCILAEAEIPTASPSLKDCILAEVEIPTARERRNARGPTEVEIPTVNNSEAFCRRPF